MFALLALRCRVQANDSANRHAHHPKSAHPCRPPPTTAKVQLKKPEDVASQSLQQQAVRVSVMAGKDVRTRPKKAAKLKGLKDMNEPEWRDSIQKACKVVFKRLETNGHHMKRENILARMTEQFHKGNINETPDDKLGHALAANRVEPPRATFVLMAA